VRTWIWAASAADAVRKHRAQPGHGAFMGGGTCLVARQDAAYDFVVDLSRAGLDTLETAATGVRCGAMVTLQSLLDDKAAAAASGGLLPAALGHTRSEPWRRQATLAGRLLEGDPGDLLAACLFVLDARIELLEAPDATPARYDLATGLARARDAAAPLVVAVSWPAPEAAWHFGLEFVARSVQDVPLAAVAVAVRTQSHKITEARVATSGLPSPRPAARTAAALRGAPTQTFDTALAALADDIAPVDDWRASAEYRTQIAGVLLARALRRACESPGRNGN
jgi:carbon-monoxide dehydrogenase medium subunit